MWGPGTDGRPFPASISLPRWDRPWGKGGLAGEQWGGHLTIQARGDHMEAAEAGEEAAVCRWSNRRARN